MQHTVGVLLATVGVIPVTVRPPNLLNLATTLPTVRMVVEVSKATAVLSTAAIIRVLRSKVSENSECVTSSALDICCSTSPNNN